MNVVNQISSLCYHCGDKCPENAVQVETKKFCCQGCKIVYEVLNSNKLTDYYKFEPSPGVSQKKTIRDSKYDFLELPEIQAKLILFKSNDLNKVEFFMPEIHCSSCIWLLENLFKLNNGVNSSRVDFIKKKVVISYKPSKVTLKEIVLLLIKIGYEPKLNLSSVSDETENKAKPNKSPYLKLGVAGFAFGNIMLLSFPEYLGLTSANGSSFKEFFGLLNIIIAIPVLLYSASEYTKPALKGILTGQMNIDIPITLGVISLFGSSVYNIAFTSQPGYMDSFAGLIFFLLLGKVFQEKTYTFLSFERDYKSYFPISVNVLKDKEEVPVMVNNLAKDDLLVIRNEELIPVDSILQKGKAYIDYSFITGESKPVVVNEGERIFSGGRQLGSALSLRVLKSFSNSDITKLWDNDVFNKQEKTASINNITNLVSKYFTAFIILIAVGTFGYWSSIDISIAIKSFTSVLIVACPCALALASPFTLGTITRVFGKNKFYLRNASVVEKIAKIDTIVFDKTGTLTSNSGSKIKFEGTMPSNDDKVLIYSLACQSNHPMSRVIKTYFKSKELDLDYSKEVVGSGMKGELQDVVIRIGKWDFVGLTNKENGTFISIGNKVFGKFVAEENYRLEVLNSLKKLINIKKLFVLSGDNERSKESLTKWFPADNLYFDKSPNDKLQFVKELNSAGHNVLMVGDGLNDAGALKASEVGISINDDVSNFSPACDAILDGKEFMNFNKFIKLSTFGIRIIVISFMLSFLYNVVGLVFAVQGELTPIFSAILMPLSSITIVLFTTIMVNLKSKKMRLL